MNHKLLGVLCFVILSLCCFCSCEKKASSDVFPVKRKIFHNPSVIDFEYYDNIGAMHNRAVLNCVTELENLAEEMQTADVSIYEHYLLEDYCYQKCCDYVEETTQELFAEVPYQTIVQEYEDLNQNLLYLQSWDDNVFYYWDSLRNIYMHVEVYDDSYLINELFVTAYDDFRSDGYIDDNEYCCLVALSVAKHSCILWEDGNLENRLNSIWSMEPMPSGMKWWKADCIGAVAGLLGGWIGAIIWGGVASLVAAIRNSLERADRQTYLEIVPDNVNRYNLFHHNSSQNPYLYCEYD